MSKQAEQETKNSTTGHAEPAGKLILRHLLAGSICAGISCVVMSAFIIGLSVVAPVAGKRILIMAVWISIGGSMAGTMGFGRENPERALGYLSSFILAALEGSLLSVVLYGLFLFLRLPFYNGNPLSVWLPLGIGVLFGVIGWGNVLGWLSAKKIRSREGSSE